jgi:hypothetical protein
VKPLSWLVYGGGDATENIAQRPREREIASGFYAKVWAREPQHGPHVVEMHVEQFQEALNIRVGRQLNDLAYQHGRLLGGQLTD